ncbi:CAAX protease self-immunity family protein [Streptococcus oralis]|jgi:CAAX amino terminal protease family protein|uniref:CPBP family intramembrane metalloprotease n=1 Tax=Streptococcus oralis subsp. oralis TaxID=1891914 RepID=A0A1X1HW77_STROR|nr:MULTISPECIES: type II CAAX endopeptidase family protein [Streptococcus]EKA15526.1 CAAX amino terminal protease family protein [Streptococcus sp. GMD2S]RSJ36635.1 CAAX amino terminal protease self- immunity [Streptococcus sp. BCA20]EFE56592.1 CAAX amino terminal protease family protein [Streptococcus oralis ATCC 35037]EFO02337.1 CAAX amino terminal protease family protein [Streptococcus oralis ATCC 35037]EFX56114.1 CAAX amino terminal protease family protein [Streptococcus sp. C300]
MKDKTIWQEVLNRGKWVIILLVAFVLSQFPIGLALFLANKQFPILQSGLLVGALSIVVLIVFIIGARKTQLATFNLSFFKAKDLARLVLSYLVIFATNLLGSLLLRLTNEATTSNQSILNGLVQNSSLISTFFLLVLIAPICEEILCRGIIPKKIFRGKEKLGFIVGAIVFALLHMPTNLPSVIIYGGMSTVLTWTAYKTERLEMSILLHMILNGIAFCLLALLVLISRNLGLSF